MGHEIETDAEKCGQYISIKSRLRKKGVARAWKERMKVPCIVRQLSHLHVVETHINSGNEDHTGHFSEDNDPTGAGFLQISQAGRLSLNQQLDLHLNFKFFIGEWKLYFRIILIF